MNVEKHDGPEAYTWGWILDGNRQRKWLRRQQVKGGVIFWVYIVGIKIVWRFKLTMVDDKCMELLYIFGLVLLIFQAKKYI